MRRLLIFTIASTPRTFNRQTNQWEDGETLFLRASVWRGYAENVAETLKKGTSGYRAGRLKSRSYETKEGERRTSFELEVGEIGPTLRFATAQVTRAQRSAGGNNFGGGAQGGLAVALGTTLLLRAVSPLLSRIILLLLRVMVTLASLATPLRLLRRPRSSCC